MSANFIEDIDMSNKNIGPAPNWPILAFIFVVIIWIFNYFYGDSLGSSEKAGQFGDMFGAVNALFSGLAFAGVFYAIILQRHEIKISRTEIENTKRILDEQQKQLDIQNNATRKQSFEDTFFKMLNLLTEITNNIEEATGPSDRLNIHRGKDAINIISRSMQSYSFYDDEDSNIIKKYDRIYEQNKSKLGHYFRILFNIFNFIDSSEVDNKNFYTKIVRAQLSDAEVSILFFNCLSRRGADRFKPLVEKYGLLKNLTDEDIVDIELKKQYDPSAFGKNSLKDHKN